MMFLWVVAIIVLLFGFVVFRGAPYVPSKKRELERAFTELYSLKEGDVLVDIGSGDGVVLRQAAKYGAMAIGYELNPLLVLISRWLCRHQPTIRVQLADFWFVSLPDNTTVVYVFGESRDIAKMAKKVADEATRLNRPISFVSYGFAVGGETAIRTVGAHHLYRFEPLHQKKA